MIFEEVFERFIVESLLSIILWLLMEQSFAEDVDDLFEAYAHRRQYHRELLFSAVANLMSLVVLLDVVLDQRLSSQMPWSDAAIGI